MSKDSIPWTVKARAGGVGLLIGLLLGGALACWETLHGNAALDLAHSTCAARTGELQTAVDLANGRATVLRARVQLSRAAMAVSQLNYGSAQTALDAARAALAKASPETAGVSAASLGAATAALDGLSLQAGADPTQQIASLNGAAQAIDRLIQD